MPLPRTKRVRLQACGARDVLNAQEGAGEWQDPWLPKMHLKLMVAWSPISNHLKMDVW